MRPEKQQRLDNLYMDIAERVSEMSYAVRLKVGSVIVRDDNIVSYGWNGTPAGEDNICENVLPDGTLTTKSEVMHSESNSIAKLAATGGVGAQGATLYTTFSPCPECAKLIKQAKIARVVYRNTYRKLDGILMLRKLGVCVDHLPYVEEPELPATAPRIQMPQALRTDALDDGDWPVHPMPPAPPVQQFQDDPQVMRLMREAATMRAPQPAPQPAPPPAPIQSSMPDEEEVQQLLREFEAHQAVEAAKTAASSMGQTPGGAAPANREAPYRSSFL